MSAPSNVPATITVRERAEAPGSLRFSFIDALTLQAAEGLRKGCDQCRDDPLMNGFLVAGAIYQLDWSALRMGVLPFRVGELSKRFPHPVMEVVIGSLHPVARATGVSAAQAFRCRYIDEERDVRDKPAGRQPVGGPDFLLRQSAPENLVGV